MPPVAYALASDAAIGVVRAWSIARHKAMNAALADDDATPLAIIGGFVLWSLRLAMAPASTLAGFRRWVIDECPVAPGRTVGQVSGAASTRPRAISARSRTTGNGGDPRPGTKTGRFLDLVTERYGPLAQFPLADVSRVCTELAPEVDLDPGAARTALRRCVLAAQPQGSK
jgi:hypothetical protein